MARRPRIHAHAAALFLVLLPGIVVAAASWPRNEQAPATGQAPPPAATHANVTIRLSLADLARARTQAARRGLRYQTYVKMLLHEALTADARRLG